MLKLFLNVGYKSTVVYLLYILVIELTDTNPVMLVALWMWAVVSIGYQEINRKE